MAPESQAVPSAPREAERQWKSVLQTHSLMNILEGKTKPPRPNTQPSLGPSKSLHDFLIGGSGFYGRRLQSGPRCQSAAPRGESNSPRSNLRPVKAVRRGGTRWVASKGEAGKRTVAEQDSSLPPRRVNDGRWSNVMWNSQPQRSAYVRRDSQWKGCGVESRPCVRSASLSVIESANAVEVSFGGRESGPFQIREYRMSSKRARSNLISYQLTLSLLFDGLFRKCLTLIAVLYWALQIRWKQK